MREQPSPTADSRGHRRESALAGTTRMPGVVPRRLILDLLARGELHRYGPDRSQRADLRLPGRRGPSSGDGPHPRRLVGQALWQDRHARARRQTSSAVAGPPGTSSIAVSATAAAGRPRSKTWPRQWTSSTHPGRTAGARPREHSRPLGRRSSRAVGAGRRGTCAGCAREHRRAHRRAPAARSSRRPAFVISRAAYRMCTAARSAH